MVITADCGAVSILFTPGSSIDTSLAGDRLRANHPKSSFFVNPIFYSGKMEQVSI